MPSLESPMPTLADLPFVVPVTIGPDADLAAAVELLVARNAMELYVVDAEQQVLGIVPDYELLKARLNGSAAELRIRQVLSPRVLCFSLETDVADVLRIFREGQHSRAALVDGNRLVGQVTRTMLLRNLIDADCLALPRPKFLQSELARNARTLQQHSYA